ncbi:two-component system sensor histidine kinase NtrB [Bacillus sp. SJS]|uniref:two-component system sensor histidine kinase NtrB n=1 Tax=Bacillus sp. SJS TaxID=1423321 RepID=UPI0004DD33AA|nr:ATP-binding protein [Bacillus sp. SJS]KZZ82913.1 hypothetical protein AS29_019140 [Bacillus sp. SJS]
MKEFEDQQELLFYKRLIDSIPFAFEYKDSESGRFYRHQPAAEQEGSFTIASLEGELLEKLEEKLAPLADLIPHHLVITDADGKITLCNRQSAADLKADPEAVIGTHIRELLRIPDQQIAILETLQTGQAIRNRELWDRNYGIVNTYIIRRHDGSISRVAGLFHFLNNLKDAEKMAMSGRIAAGIAHEIRNPLTTVRGYLQLLSGQLGPDMNRLFSALLIPEIDRANGIITDFLRLSKTEALPFETLYVSDFLKGYLGKFLHSEAFLHDTDLIIDCKKVLPETAILGNKEELLQVFMNLFANAQQAKTINKKLKVDVKAAIYGDVVQISFSDNGSGIEPEVLVHIFDPFFTMKDDGTGLGLSISRKIIENHHGELRVVSNKEGTSFYMEFPIALTEPNEDR